MHSHIVVYSTWSQRPPVPVTAMDACKLSTLAITCIADYASKPYTSKNDCVCRSLPHIFATAGLTALPLPYVHTW